MKISEKPTDTILVKVRTNSQWDKCDFALIDISADWCNRLMHRAKEVKSLSGDQDFYCQVYWDTPLGYFSSADGEEDVISNYLNRQERTGVL